MISIFSCYKKINAQNWWKFSYYNRLGISPNFWAEQNDFVIACTVACRSVSTITVRYDCLGYTHWLMIQKVMCTSRNMCAHVCDNLWIIIIGNSYNYHIVYVVSIYSSRKTLCLCILIVINNSDERFSLIVVLVEVNFLYWYVRWWW